MIQVFDLVGKGQCAEELKDLKLWQMDVEEVMPAHLQGFFYRSKLRTDRQTAKDCANLIANTISEAHESRIVKNSRLNDFSISEPPFLSSELRKSLSKMSLVSRRCIYFSLLMNWPIEEAMSLTWETVNKLIKDGMMYNHDAAVDVLDAMPRHIKNNLVFWEVSKNKSLIPMVGLSLDIEMAFDCSYEELQEKFQSMLMIDPAIHSEELKVIWGKTNG